MRSLTSIMSAVLLYIILISSYSSSALCISPDLEWKVNIGDSQTYRFLKFKEAGKTEVTQIIADQKVIIKKGTLMKIEIAELPEASSIAQVYVSYNGGPHRVTQSTIYSILKPTIDNKSYWEEAAKFDEDASVQDDLYIISSESEIEMEQMIYILETKRNWRTGWLMYFFEKMYNSTYIYQEIEIELSNGDGNGAGLSGFEIPLLSLGVFVLMIFLDRRHKKFH